MSATDAFKVADCGTTAASATAGDSASEARRSEARTPKHRLGLRFSIFMVVAFGDV
ncbi:hypothetical protein [Streptomyces sp. NPDC096311]|uniref:hypothetical protein n=1 Tax=Streptomyces sp. NPDC096311 TaxID=3366083 RepID=UPI0037F29FD0